MSVLKAAEAKFCLDLQNIKSNHMPPVYRDTKAGLILTVKLGSTPCMSYSKTYVPKIFSPRFGYPFIVME